MSSRFLQTVLILNSCAGMPLTQNQRKLLIQISYHRYKEFVYIWFNFCPYMIELAYISLRMTIAWNKWLCLCCCYCFGKDSFQTSSLKSPAMKKKLFTYQGNLPYLLVIRSKFAFHCPWKFLSLIKFLMKQTVLLYRIFLPS